MWQPIETAPKDGTIIDLWHKKVGRVTETWWDTDCWVTTLERDDKYSHWMHMPEPPPPKKRTE